MNASSASAIVTADVTLGDHVLHVSTSGPRSGKPVLWLHGSGPGATALSNWERVIDSLAIRFFNIAPDILGFGDSTHPVAPPRGIGRFAALRCKSLLELLDAPALERVNIVSHSMGGLFALLLAKHHPERVGKLILLGSAGAPLPPGPSIVKLVKFYDDPSVSAMTALMREFVYDPALFGHDLEAIATARMPRATREDVRRSHLATFDMTHPPEPRAPEWFESITHETLLIHGREDRMLDVKSSIWLQAHLPNARLFVIPKCGHWTQIEHPQVFEHLVAAFMRGEL